MRISRDTKRKSKREEKANHGLDINTLDTLCKYVISDSGLLRTAHLSSLKRLIDGTDPKVYISDIERQKRVQFIQEALIARLEYHLTDPKMIMIQVNNSLDFNVDFIDLDHPMNNDEIKWAGYLIENELKYLYMYNHVDELMDSCTQFVSSDSNNKMAVVKQLETAVNAVKNDLRHAEVESNAIDMTFSLREGEFEEVITDTYNLVTNPNRRLICGMSGLNEMVGGGFEAGRVYMLFGLGGVGKSLTLLNLLTQFKKYNTHYRTKDPTKIPCVVLLTMENTVVETITRLFSMSDPNGGTMLDYSSVDDVLRILRNDGGLTISQDSPIDIIIKYKANKSVDTSYLYTLCEDLDDQGYEVICLIQDHVKRIRSIYNALDLRIELGDIVNEMKVFAAEKDIPVISVSHLNRDAARIMEDGSGRAGGTADLTMKLGKSNVGESLLMIDNLDCGIIINLEFDQNGNRFLCYNLIKMRDKVERTYIAQPFQYGSTIKLVEDVGMLPMFKQSLKEPNDKPRTSSIRVTNNAVKGIDAIINDTRDEVEENAFSDNSYRVLEQPKDEEEMFEEQPIKHEKICPLYFFEDFDKKLTGLEAHKRKLEESRNII